MRLLLYLIDLIAHSYKRGIDHLADKDLKYTAIPSMTPKTYHMLISRNFKYAEELKRIIDEGITSLEESGRLDVLLKKH